ncbi:E3 ubiquitin-protein ligase TTC3-like [Orbicella faveolata]|uniref:E3 ubiquitin-protein ligase TTC3-like n=1 Tax=Orbicella faveolata TaxID=48498 RepID=UPI0009E27EBD|nr:E3 ubiquitin-protein ligase TTC3-like [Orbicella faveolata]
MPSNPRRVKANKEGMAKTTAKASDSEDCDDLPDLVDCTDDEDSGEEEYHKKPPTKAKGKAREKPAPKAKNNAECADMWYKMSKDEREKHIHVMRVYLLSPFLFGQVYQEDKWINWAYDCKLLPSKSSFEQKYLDEQYFDAVDLVETAFNKLADNVLLKNKDGLVKTLDIIGSAGLTMAQHVDKAITCAESFLAFTSIRDKIKLKSGISKKQGDMALLLAHNQVADHIKLLAAGEDLVEKFNKRCKEEEDRTADQKKEGNEAFSSAKFSAAISTYSRALHVSPYNHVLYGNRSQSFLKTKDLWSALTDGRRAVVLKADWHKAQYRYAQAFFEMGNFARAKEVNRAACKICTDKKDLESQFEKFEKGIKAIVGA